MQQEIRFATFNVCNLAPPGMKYYERMEPYTPAEYKEKVVWTARQLDQMDADVIGFQEIFSQATLKDVLAQTRRYQHAHHVGFDPAPDAERLTPSVALVSRLPIVGEARAIRDLPADLCDVLPHGGKPMVRFTRPVLHAVVQLSDEVTANVFVLHLKSKLPDFVTGEQENNYQHFGMAKLRSLIRRGTEALGVRLVIADTMQNSRLPAIVMGDFNDVLMATTTQLVMGEGQRVQDGGGGRLFDAHRIQRKVSRGRDVSFTDIYDGRHETIDHILLSEEFHFDSPKALGAVEEVLYFNDHVAQALPHASDHGQVVARIRLHGESGVVD